MKRKNAHYPGTWESPLAINLYNLVADVESLHQENEKLRRKVERLQNELDTERERRKRGLHSGL